MFAQHDTSHYNKLMHSFSATVLILGLAAIPQMAQAEGWYAGLGFGNTKIKDDSTCSDAGSLFDPGYSCSVDTKDTGKKVFVGYQFNKNGAVQFGYADLGKFSANASGTSAGIPSTASADLKIKGFDLALVGSLPVTNEFSVLGQIGLFRWDVKVDASATGNLVAENQSATGTDAAFGVGAQYDFSKTVGARMEWERFKDVGKSDTTGKGDVDLFSLSLVFRFQ